MQKFRHYLSLIKFSHTIFALPFALIGYALAIKEVNLTSESKVKLLLLVVLCMVFARSAAMAFNRFIDRKIDAKNPRTASREIPAGIIAEKKALYFVIINGVLFIATTFFINPICFYLSPIALFTILFYSYTKRFTRLCHFVLGIGLSLAPIHPFIIESMERWKELPENEKNKIYFIHLNHTNPLLQKNHPYRKSVLSAGFNVAKMGAIFGEDR
jgi:4-hydroxybenzoate polyprenyltransferase